MPARLTIDQFIAELREKTEREGAKWGLTAVGRLRTRHGGLRCPVCPLAYVMDTLIGYEEAARKRGMTQHDIGMVEDGADWTNTIYPEVRAQLLAATGVA